MGTAAGLARFDVATASPLPVSGFPRPGVPVSALAVDGQGRVFVGLDKDGVVLGLDGGARWRPLAFALGADEGGARQVRALHVDRAGLLWIGSEAGLDGLRLDAEGGILESVRYRGDRFSDHGIGSGVVAAVMEDSRGILWAGTWNQGVSWLSRERNRFASYTTDTPVTRDFRNPASIALAAVGLRLWIGTASGLYGFDTTQPRLWEVSPGLDPYLYYCAQTVGEEVWFGHVRGLRQLEATGQQYLERVLPGDLANGRVRRLLVEGDRVWIAVDPIAVVLMDRSLERELARLPLRRQVTFIAPLDERFVLVGSYGGLYWLDARTGELRHHHAIVPAGNGPPGKGQRLPLAPMDLALDHHGRAWLATNGSGLAELTVPAADPAEARFRFLPPGQGPADGSLKAIEVDGQGRLWISTASGLSLFDPETERTIDFGVADGTLPRDYINLSSTRLQDGRIVFGGMDGFTLFDPDKVLQRPRPPVAPPLFHQLVVDGRTLPLGRGLGSPQGGAVEVVGQGGIRSLSVGFGSVEYLAPKTLRYRYRMRPLETGWSEVGAEQATVTYTGLQPGVYTLEVEASRDRQRWSPTRVLRLGIEPLWWQRAGVRWAGLLLLGLLLLALHRLRTVAIARHNARLAAEVQARTHDLEQAKRRAEQALAQLEAAQAELIRSEKMAALGQLVTGVAHEVNTPLGVALTAGSALSASARQMQEKVAAGPLRRSEFEQFLASVAEGTDMIERNLERAAQLIQHFKQVSVDRSSDGRRRFDLGRYVNEVVESLRLLWKRRPIQLSIDCTPGLELDSFPGAIGQVVTNLAQNALIHAFPDGRGGTLRIECRALDGERVEIRFCDDGVGMSEEVLQHAFDPFFTTRRAEGGSGLGLHIVYNLVTQKLGGRVSLHSRPGEGCCCVIELPRKAPE